MTLEILGAEHVERIFQMEKAELEPRYSSPIEAAMAGWDVPWRKESLEFHASKGWSFVALEGDVIQGYALGQNIPFFRNQTQVLWVEHMQFHSEAVAVQLVDFLKRYAREKHLQSVCLNMSEIHRLDGGKAVELEGIALGLGGRWISPAHLLEIPVGKFAPKF